MSCQQTSSAQSRSSHPAPTWKPYAASLRMLKSPSERSELDAPSPVIRSLASPGRPGDARLYPLTPQATKTLVRGFFTNKATSGRGGIRPGIDPKATVAVPARSEACGPLKGLPTTAPRKAAIAASERPGRSGPLAGLPSVQLRRGPPAPPPRQPTPSPRASGRPGGLARSPAGLEIEVRVVGWCNLPRFLATLGQR